MIYIDKANPADRPGTTVSQLGESLVAQGAKLVIFSSDDMADEAVKFAKAHPDIFVIMTSGSQVWKDGKTYQDLPNMVNIMGRMEFGKMIAGVAAAMTTQTGQIGYLGPLINDETRRLASSVYLGARYAWTNYLKKDPVDSQVQGHLDRVLVQHPWRHLRSLAGGGRFLQQRVRRRGLRHRHHGGGHGSGEVRRAGQEGVGGSLRLRQRLPDLARGQPRRPVLQLGTRLRDRA